MNDSKAEGIAFDRPAWYRICVCGKVRPNWSDRLEGMSISVAEREDCSTATTLTGELSDQASLTGVLNTLYELHLPVLFVECLGARPPD